MNYFKPTMINSYRLYKIAHILTNDYQSIFEQLYQHLLKNKNFKQFCEQSNFIKKNNSYFLLYKLKKDFKCIQQFVLQFDIQEQNIDYDISVYCKSYMLDNKFYYPTNNILNKSARTFDKNDQRLVYVLKEYFDDVFDKYFQIYRKHVDNGYFV